MILILTLLTYSFIINVLIATPPFKQWPEMDDLNCRKILKNDVNYIKEKASHRITISDNSTLATDCSSIRSRHYFSDRPASVEELDFPIAFSRTVFKDYFLVESELASSYTPQNWYCYGLDAKVNELFRQRMHSLAACFPNVFVSNKEFLMDSQGHNQTESLLECMNQLATQDRKWSYMFTLQNHDVQLKTNQELVQIFKWMDGANDMELCSLPDGRVNTSLDWTLEGLGLFKNKTDKFNDASGRPLEVQFGKGYLQTALSRAFVDFVLQKLDVRKIVAQISTGAWFVDEIFFQTIGSTEALEAPGGFTHQCIDQNYTSPCLTRFQLWFANNTRCHSKFSRHHVCIFGLEDVPTNLNNSHSLFANKMWPTFDFGAIRCWHEEMYNRTHFYRGIHRLLPSVYLQLPQVRYNAEKKRLNSLGAVGKLSNFECTYNISVEEKLKMYDGQTDEKRKHTPKAVFENILKYKKS